MGTSSKVLLVIPASPAWDISAAVLDISRWLAQRGFDLAATKPGAAAATLTLLNRETVESVELIITTTEHAVHFECRQVLDLACREEVENTLSRLLERLVHLRLFTTPMASHARDEDILLRRLADLGYL